MLLILSNPFLVLLQMPDFIQNFKIKIKNIMQKYSFLKKRI